jgi:DtxR family Mn-dependent transcriptional regulator
MATEAMQRYAAEIYRLQEDLEYVGLSELSEHVNASAQAVARMVARMKELGFIEQQLYRGVRLTPTGERIAMPVLRRHRIAEIFLVKVMSFGWHEVHDDSERMEKGISLAVEERMAAMAGNPTRCPHGEPIPSRAGVMPVVRDASLVTRLSGNTYRLSRVRTHDPDRLKYLGELGLYPGTSFTLVSLAPFEGPVSIRRERQDIILGHDLAAALYVEI